MNTEQLQADRKRLLREIGTWTARGLTEEHPNIQVRRKRIRVIDALLTKPPT